MRGEKGEGREEKEKEGERKGGDTFSIRFVCEMCVRFFPPSGQPVSLFD